MSRDEKKWGKQERWAERWTEGWDELSQVTFISMPVCEMKKEWLPCSAEKAPYLAVHEFKVDSFQSDLQESTFTSFHVLDREFSTQFWTWKNISSLTRYNMNAPSYSRQERKVLVDISIYKIGITSLIVKKLPPIKYNSQQSVCTVTHKINDLKRLDGHFLSRTELCV